MTKPNSTVLAAAILLMGVSAQAAPAVPPEPDIVANVCSQCHGDRGLSMSPLFPNLAAQDKDYLVAQLKAFRDRKRSDPHAQAYMWGMANQLTDERINQIAAYFSALPPPVGSNDQDANEVAAGKKIFEQGIDSEQVPACNACHGEKAAGTSTIPRLAGQHREYLAAQILAFRNNERQNEVMHGNVQHMTDKQVRDIAAFLSSL